MYGISIQKPGGCVFIRSAEISRMVADREYSDEQMRHLAAIEQIEARGIKYSGQDFDVLSAAYDFATREAFSLDTDYRHKRKKEPVCGTNPNRLQKLLVDDVKWEPNQKAMFPQ